MKAIESLHRRTHVALAACRQQAARLPFNVAATIGYALGATAWVFFSDRMLSGVTDVALITELATVKGIAFVAITTGLLLVALHKAGKQAQQPKLDPHALPDTRGRPWPLLVVFATLSVCVAIIALVAYQNQSAAVKQSAMDRLQTVTRLKIEDISRWLNERRANAWALSHSPVTRDALAQWLRTGDLADRQRLIGVMRALADSYGFANIQLLDAEGRHVLGARPDLPAVDPMPVEAEQAVRDEETVFVDLHRTSAGDAVRLDLLAPVFDKGGEGRQALGVLLFELDPNGYLYPLLQAQPLPTTTGETLLVRRDGNDLLILNDPRGGDSALKARVSLTNQPSSSETSLLDHERGLEAMDPRQVRVLTAALPVPGTPWTVISRIDEAEALGEINHLAVTTAILIVVALAGSLAFVGFLWQRQRVRVALAEMAQGRALEASEIRYRATFEHAAVGIAHIAVDGRWLRVNQRFCDILGYDHEELTTKNIRDLTHPDDQPASLLKRRQLLSGEVETINHEKRYFRKDGSIAWVAFTCCLLRDEDGNPDYFISVVEDISQRKENEVRLRQAATVFSNTREGVLITEPDGHILTANKSFTDITGYGAAEIIGQTPRILKSGVQTPDFYQRMWSSLQVDGYWKGEIWNRRKNGDVYPELLTISAVHDESGKLINYIGTFSDITEAKQTEARLERLAHYDSLTDLPNRVLLLSRLEQALVHAGTDGCTGAVIYFDLDRFKNVNDSLGHLAGDELLVLVAQRLQERMLAGRMLARLGGDEFIMLLEAVAERKEAAAVAQAAIDLLAEPFVLSGGQEIYIGTSAGISIFPDDGATGTTLIQHADAALYQAKNAGRGTYRFYGAEMTRAASSSLLLDGQLRRALERNEFVLYYQPLISLPDGRIKGAEALVRWQHPVEGMVSPDKFIPLTEETGLIVPLGEWVLRTACAQMQEWNAAGMALETMAVNLSPRQFLQPNLAGMIGDILAETGLNGNGLELEVTEGALVEQVERVEAKLKSLKTLGIRLAIDDFGTGYSSLTYLKRLPIDKLKIDQSFVRDIPNDHANMKICTAIIALAKGLGLEVLAEGVETEAQLKFLNRKGCDAAQGYLFFRPLPVRDFTTLLGTYAGAHLRNSKRQPSHRLMASQSA